MAKDLFSLKISEFAQILSKVSELKQEGEWEKAIQVIGVNINRLVRMSPMEFRRLSEVGLFARLVENGATIWVPCKLAMLIALLKETGDYATFRDPPNGGFGWYLKALHLLLDALALGKIREGMEIVPKIEFLRSALRGSSIPLGTRLLLIHEYERTREFGKIMDEFLAAVERFPNKIELVKHGIVIFERLERESDKASRLCGFAAHRN